jgi:dethiobiotin synthetase
MRPPRLAVVVGTSTEVGKTWVTVALAHQLGRRGLRVAARKPAQSFRPGEATDAEALGAATGEAAYRVCPAHRWYERPLAPPMAAHALERPAFTIAELVDELAWPDEGDIGLIEGAGGVRSPLANDGDVVDLIAAVAPEFVVLVADAGLGTLNLVRMSVDALRPWPASIYLNRFDPGRDLHQANREWLTTRLGLTVDTDIAQLAGRLS